jgi:hypothetical protein
LFQALFEKMLQRPDQVQDQKEVHLVMKKFLSLISMGVFVMAIAPPVLAQQKTTSTQSA